MAWPLIIGISALVNVGVTVGQGIASKKALDENLKTAREDAAVQTDAELVNMYVGLPGALNAAAR